MKLLKLFIFLMILSQTMLSAPSGSHTFHTSLTRMDYNAKDKTVEISIQLFTHDLTTVLEKQNKKNIDLEDTPDIDALILKYLEANFILKNKSGEIQKIKFVGKEIQAETTYIYLEIASAESLEGYNFSNTIFFESYEKQVNLAVINFGDNKKADLYFKVGDKEKTIVKGESPK
jgi:hypothetical protein